MMIRKLRIQRAWSQEQLAEFSGLSIRTVQRVEQGQAASLETLKSLAAVFEVNVSQLQLEPDMGSSNTSISPTTSPSSHNAVAATPSLPLPQAQLPLDEQQALYHVKKLRGFYGHAIRYALIISLLAVINLVTYPKYLWFLWTMGGWGIGLLAHGLSTFGFISWFGPEWEKRQVEKRLGRKL
jgi:transcriptional regulator with XRE-family HTH domain